MIYRNQEYQSNAELMHVGVLGMKWGVRKSRSNTSTSTSKAQRPPSEDYLMSRKLKAKGVKSLTTKELKDLTARMQLEQQYKQLSPSSYKKGMNFVKGLTTAGTTIASLYALSKTPLAQDIKKALTKG